MARALSLALLLLVASTPCVAQKRLSLEQVAARDTDDTRPAMEGAQVSVVGVVTSRPVVFKEYTHISIVDDGGIGLILEAPDFMFEHVVPGDTLEVTGLVAQRDGMAVLRPVQLTTLSRKTPPPIQLVTIERLRSWKYVGRVVTLEGRVVALGKDSSGEYLVLGDGHATYAVYLPSTANRLGAGLNRYKVGDGIRATGIAAMAANNTRESGSYQLEVGDTTGVVLLERSWLVSPQILLAVVVMLGVFGGSRFRDRQRRMALRLSVRRIHAFGEELLTASSIEETMRKLRTMAPRGLEVGGVEVYSYDRGGQQLRPMLATEKDAIAVQATRKEHNATPLSANETKKAAVALCFRNRTPLHIADTRRSSLFKESVSDGLVRAVVLLPMFAREELIGVFELTHTDRPRRFDPEELAALQHLANQVSIVWQQLERQARKEQMLRSERLAATGEVILGVAGELRAPLESIAMLAHRLLEHDDPHARALLDQSLRASAILNRYRQVAQLEEATPVELNPIVERAMDAVRQELGSDLQLSLALWSDALWILASAAQMENVLHNLLLHAASAAQVSQDRSLRVESATQGRRVLLTIRYGALLCDEQFPQLAGSPQALGFGVCKGIVHGMGGDIRVLSAGENACRIEIELPAAFAPDNAGVDSPQSAGREESSSMLTALILEPDPATQKRLISYWTAKKNRAVPVHNDTEALELMRRFRIDVIFCGVRLGPGNWVDFFDRVRGQAPVFVLVADAIDPDASLFFPQGEGLLLRKPLEAGEFSRLLDRIEQRLASDSPIGSESPATSSV